MEKSEIQRIIFENRWIEDHLFNKGTVENSIWATNSPKRDLITKWAQNLEKLHNAGIYKEPIHTISSHISDKLRKAGMDSAVHYVRESLDFKYKNPSLMRGESLSDFKTEGEDNPRQISSELLAEEAREENHTFIKFLKETIELLQKIQQKCEETILLEPRLEKDEAEQMFDNWTHIMVRCRNCWDDRSQILLPQQYIMGYALAGFSANHAHVKYQKYCKEKEHPLTEKQATKFARLEVSKVDEFFTPKNFTEAKELGFYGQQCHRCGSWRTKIKYEPHRKRDMLYCFNKHTNDTDNWMELNKTMKFKEIVI